MTKKGTTITRTDIVSKVKTHLSVIGKRLNQKAGDKNYQNIVLTDSEKGVLNEYIQGAFAYLAAQFPEYISVFTVGSGVQLEFVSNRFNDYQEYAFEQAVNAYVFSYTIGSYLAMVWPELAKKYQQETASYLLAARSLVTAKTPPDLTETDFLSAPTVSVVKDSNQSNSTNQSNPTN